MFNFIQTFPNNIFIPKIVPLVYDDTLSYYEFLCKVLNKMNECIVSLNALGVRVEALEQAVAQLQEIVDQFDERISTCEGNISELQGAVDDINTAIDNINGAITTINNTLTTLSGDVQTNTQAITVINSAISDIRDDIEELSGVTTDISEIEGDITTLDGRVTTLESATFGDISVSPSNWNVEFDMRSLKNFNYEIVNTALSPTEDQTVTIRTATPDQIAFYRSGDICYLKLKNFLVKPRLANLNTALLNLVGSFALECQTSAQKVLYKKEGVTLSTLIDGLTCTPSNDGFARLQLVESEDGDYYDLHIYPVYGDSSYPYSWVNVNMFIFSPVSTFGSQTMDVCKFLSPSTKQILDLIQKNGADLTEIEQDISELQGDVSDLDTAVSGVSTELSEYKTSNNTRVGNVESSVSSLSNTVSSLSSSVSGATTLETWDNFSDVFESGVFPTNSKINWFHMEKLNGIVTFEIAGTGFEGSNFPNFYLGSLRSGVRSKLTPRGNVPCTFAGFTGNTFNYNTDNTKFIVSGNTSNTSQAPVMPDINGVCVGTLYGNDGTPPYNNAYGVTNPAYGLCVRLSGYPGGGQIGTSFVLRGCYKTI